MRFDISYPYLDIEPYHVEQPEQLPDAVRERQLGIVTLESLTPDDMLMLARIIGEPRPEPEIYPPENMLSPYVTRITAHASRGLLSTQSLSLHTDEGAALPYDMGIPAKKGPDWLQLGQPYALALGCERPPEPHEGGQTLFFDPRHLYDELDDETLEVLGQSRQSLITPMDEITAPRPVLSGSRELPHVAYADRPNDIAIRLMGPADLPVAEDIVADVARTMREIFSDYARAIPWKFGLVVAWRNEGMLHGRTEQIDGSKRSLLRVKIARPHNSAAQTKCQ
ncbi:MAG TPA: TauD/TfdA family dioxygenase [Candidatus Limnocylindria bacterium]|nr:TauD/TfdA family dioxygenase [Candidatus Limnocylindria bacterium]